MNGADENNPQDHDEIANLKYSYDKALDIFRLHNDNYFKRTQIIMVAIQAGLFFVIIKLLTPIPVLPKELILPMIVILIGGAIAWAWGVLMTRQMQYMDLLKKYLRNLEAEFKKLDVPADYFNVEYATSSLTVKDPQPQITTASVEGPNGGMYVEFKWSKAKCPEPENGTGSDGPNWFVIWIYRMLGCGGEDRYMHKIGVLRGKIVLIEKRMSVAILLFWLLGFLTLLTWFIYCLCYSPCSC